MLLASLTASAQEISISTTAVNGGLALVAGDKTAPIVVSENDAEVVKTVAQCLSDDVKAVTGQSLAVTTARRPCRRSRR